MSVPKSERRQSLQEYVVILQQVEQFFLNQNLSDKYRIPLLSEELCRLSMEAYNDATRIFEMTIGTIRGTVADKKKYCKKAIWTIRELAAQINIMVAFRMSNHYPVTGMVEITQKLLKAIELIEIQLDSLH